MHICTYIGEYSVSHPYISTCFCRKHPYSLASVLDMVCKLHIRIMQADEPRAFLHGKYIAMNSCTNMTVSDQLQEKRHSLHPLCLSGPSTRPLQCHPTSGPLQNAYGKLKKAHLSTRQQSSHMNGPNAEQGCHALHHGNRGQDNERTLHIVLATETGLPYR